jgi:hypothetical protein
MPMRTKNLASEEKSPGYATPKSRLVPEKHLSKYIAQENFKGLANIAPEPKNQKRDGVSDPDPATLLNPDRHHNFTSCYQISF